MMSLAAKMRNNMGNLAKLARTVRALVSKPRIECAVGFPVDASGLGTPEAAYEGEASIIQVAIWNNYGTDTTPARPFMDLASKNIATLYKNRMLTEGPKITRGEATVEKTLDLIGMESAEEVKKAIMDGDWAPDSPATIARKKSSRPLVDTSTMVNRVTHKVRTARAR